YVIPSFTFLSPRPPTFTLFPYTTLFRSVESKPGADGAIGTAEVVRAAPDGYTLLLGPTAVYAVTPHLFKNLGFDPLTALDPISLDRKSTRLNSSHVSISYAVFCLKKKKR